MRATTTTTTTANADPQELAKFSELAHRWWDPESEFRPLHQINPLRLDWIAGFVPRRPARVRRRGLRRRHPPTRWRDAARTCWASTWRKPLKVAQLHAMEAGTASCAARWRPRRWQRRSPATFDVVTRMEMLEHA